MNTMRERVRERVGGEMEGRNWCEGGRGKEVGGGKRKGMESGIVERKRKGGEVKKSER